jgi:hypothetical protein
MTCQCNFSSISQAQEVAKSIEVINTLVTDEISNKRRLDGAKLLQPVKGNPFPEPWAENFQITKAFNATPSKVQFEFVEGKAVVVAVGNKDGFNIATFILDSHSVRISLEIRYSGESIPLPKQIQQGGVFQVHPSHRLRSQ